MFMSTLPAVPGYSYQVLGLVYASATLGAIGGGNLDKMMRSLSDQATHFGADGIVDIKTVVAGANGNCVMTGTAIRLIPAATG